MTWYHRNGDMRQEEWKAETNGPLPVIVPSCQARDTSHPKFSSPRSIRSDPEEKAVADGMDIRVFPSMTPFITPCGRYRYRVTHQDYQAT